MTENTTPKEATRVEQERSVPLKEEDYKNLAEILSRNKNVTIIKR